MKGKVEKMKRISQFGLGEVVKIGPEKPIFFLSKSMFLETKKHLFFPFSGIPPGTSWPFWGEFVTDFHPLQHVLPSFSREHNALFMRPVDHEFKNKIIVCNL